MHDNDNHWVVVMITASASTVPIYNSGGLCHNRIVVSQAVDLPNATQLVSCPAWILQHESWAHLRSYVHGTRRIHTPYSEGQT
jgi:hypothetical protein